MLPLFAEGQNDLNIQLLLDIHPTFRQLVSKPTYKLSTLDVFVSDLVTFTKNQQSDLLYNQTTLLLLPPLTTR